MQESDKREISCKATHILRIVNLHACVKKDDEGGEDELERISPMNAIPIKTIN